MRSKLILPATLGALALGFLTLPSQARSMSEAANLGIAGNAEPAHYGWRGYRHWDRRHYRHGYRYYYRDGHYGYRRHRRHHYYY